MPFPKACVHLFSAAHSLCVEKFSVYHDTSIIDCCWLCLDFKELKTFLCALCHLMVVCFMLRNCYSFFECVNLALFCLFFLVLQKSSNNEVQCAVCEMSTLFQIYASLDFIYLCALYTDYAISPV
jgi:hypothetical protein